jgi:uncharacterized C2H2 Zn-finger protein
MRYKLPCPRCGKHMKQLGDRTWVCKRGYHTELTPCTHPLSIDDGVNWRCASCGKLFERHGDITASGTIWPGGMF